MLRSLPSSLYCSTLGWEQVQESLEGVEHRFRETAHKAVRIGDRLSRMEGQRTRAADAMDLLEFFKVLTDHVVRRLTREGGIGTREGKGGGERGRPTTE